MKKLMKVALLVGAVTVAAKIVTAKKAEWQGLTEPQVREKLDSQLPDRMPDDKRADISDKVVSKMRERGMLSEEDEATTPAPTDSDATSASSADATVDDDAGEDNADDAGEDNADDAGEDNDDDAGEDSESA